MIVLIGSLSIGVPAGGGSSSNIGVMMGCRWRRRSSSLKGVMLPTTALSRLEAVQFSSSHFPA
jgi:hypothetical protein